MKLKSGKVVMLVFLVLASLVMDDALARAAVISQRRLLWHLPLVFKCWNSLGPFAQDLVDYVKHNWFRPSKVMCELVVQIPSDCHNVMQFIFHLPQFVVDAGLKACGVTAPQ